MTLENEKKISDILAKMNNEIEIKFFRKDDSEIANTFRSFLTKLSELGSGKIKIEEETVDDSAIQEKKLLTTPAIAIRNMRYYGIPSGFELGPFLELLVSISNNEIILSEDSIEKTKNIDSPVDIKVFVTPTCPYCPKAIIISYMMAMINDKIKASTIDASEFSELSEKYDVMTVPKIVVNEKSSFEGAYPEKEYIKEVLKALK